MLDILHVSFHLDTVLLNDTPLQMEEERSQEIVNFQTHLSWDLKPMFFSLYPTLLFSHSMFSKTQASLTMTQFRCNRSMGIWFSLTSRCPVGTSGGFSSVIPF